ncbi:hypothetical protein BDP81DRAFT_482392 [Colletotrichum phormii]|uniref:Subtilisin-like serine protease n=1 Tax=Colletotrichum phormii TaxID=359342 RepID=A0AAI9ZMV0_9PEZI|nr:uncharacterized protein BDP81DRAFT_482392 [Colletotrichum phormii]KAK1634575.1 hypothetical protein BDP81DRAFT_482392 [Colletotrichum phormii]
MTVCGEFHLSEGIPGSVTALQQHRSAVRLGKTDLPSLLPASRRTEDDDLECLAATHQPTGILEWVNEELNVDRLKDIHDWLWIVGRPMPPRSLHYQRLLNREVIIMEKLDMHLVWINGRIFIKPLPRYLLEQSFWGKYLCSHEVPLTSIVHDRALGFLFSYAVLIMHESDFHIAKELHLIPEKVQWPAWRVKPLCGYTSRWNQYGSFFYDNFVLLASSTVYIAVVLTAMQVGLATEALQGNKAFQSASYGFTVFSIVGPLAAAVLVIVVFCYLFIGNWVATRHYSRERLKRIQGR